jgi:hypothetical protein
VTYRWLDALDQAFTAAGIPYVEVPFSYSDPTKAESWRTRGRPPATGQFDPTGVLCHHTASPAGTLPSTDLRVILAGNGSAPGPISQLYIGRDARLYLIAAGRANHGGKGRRPGIDGSCADMNAALIGIEVGNNGTGERWADPVTDLYARTVVALCDWYGWATPDVYLHATTGPPEGGCNEKIDPAGPWQRQPGLVGSTTWDLAIWRSFIDEHRGPAPPTPQPPSGDDDMPTPIGFITCDAGTRGHHIDGSVYEVKITGTFFYVMPGGTIQWIHDGGELATKQAVNGGAGLRTDTWNTPVGDPDVFGMLVGDVPGRP